MKAERKQDREAEKEKENRTGTGLPSVATRLIALPNQISISAVASLLCAHYQKLICCHSSSLAYSRKYLLWPIRKILLMDDELKEGPGETLASAQDVRGH